MNPSALARHLLPSVLLALLVLLASQGDASAFGRLRHRGCGSRCDYVCPPVSCDRYSGCSIDFDPNNSTAPVAGQDYTLTGTTTPEFAGAFDLVYVYAYLIVQDPGPTPSTFKKKRILKGFSIARPKHNYGQSAWQADFPTPPFTFNAGDEYEFEAHRRNGNCMNTFTGVVFQNPPQLKK